MSVFSQAKSLLNRPSGVESILNRVAVDAELTGPLRQSHALAVEFDDAALACVVVLLFPRNPFAVGWLVVAIHVDALKRVARRALAEISEEGLKCHPELTNGNAAAPVFGIFAFVWICASRFHAAPTLVGDCLVHPMSRLDLVRMKGPRSLFSCKTAARTCAGLAFRHAQLKQRHINHSAAIAAAAPNPIAVFSGSRPFQGDKAPEMLPCNVSRHIGRLYSDIEGNL